MPSKRRYAIALSFPSAHISFVRKVAHHLAEEHGRDRIFFFRWPEHEHKIAGANAVETLTKIYQAESDLVIPFFSEHYKSRWCKIEWRSIRLVLEQRRSENSVVPVHLDLTPIRGWKITDVGIRRDKKSSKTIAEMILRIYQDRFVETAPETILFDPHFHRATVANAQLSALISQIELERERGSLLDSFIAPAVVSVLKKAKEIALASNCPPQWCIAGIRLSDEYVVRVRSSAGVRDWQRDFAAVAAPTLVGVARSLERSPESQAIIIKLCTVLAKLLRLKLIWPEDADDHNDLVNALYLASVHSTDHESDDVYIALKGLGIRGPQ
jgi:hypothetical protein